jgi:hypothetical protein
MTGVIEERRREGERGKEMWGWMDEVVKHKSLC